MLFSLRRGLSPRAFKFATFSKQTTSTTIDCTFILFLSRLRISDKVCRWKKNNLYEFKTTRRYAKTSFGLIHIFENKERSISGTPKNYDKFMPKICRVVHQNIYKLSFSHSTMSFISLLSRSLEDHRQICTTYINAGIIYAVSHVRISFHI